MSALPEWVGEHVCAVANEARITVDAPALLTVAAIGAAAGKRVVVEYRMHDTHFTNLWALAVLPPSEGKTPLIGAIGRPFRRAQQALHEGFHRREVDRRTDLRILRVRRQAAAGVAARLPVAADEQARTVARQAVRDIELEIARLESEREPTLLVEDMTPEALVAMLGENHGVVTMLSDEGSILFSNALRSAHEDLSNIENLLKAHSGEDIDQRRISRGAITVPKPVLSVLIATQPRVVRGLLRRGTFAERGFWERFLFVAPPSLVGHRGRLGAATFPLLPGLYSRTVSALLALPILTVNSSERRVLRFNLEGERVLEEFFAEIDGRMGHGDLLDPGIRGWAGKLRTNTIRIAACLHLAEMHTVPSTEPNDPANVIPPALAQNAIVIARWCLEQAQTFLSGDVDEDSDVQAVVSWIRRRDRRVVRPRDIQHSLGYRFPTIQSLMPTIDRMVQRELLTPRNGGSRNGRPPTEYDVSQAIFTPIPGYARQNDES